MIYKLKITNYDEVFGEKPLFKESQILSKSGNIYLMDATSDEVIKFLKYYSDQSEIFNPLDYLIKFVCCSTDDIVDYVNDILYLEDYSIYLTDYYYNTAKQTIDYFTVDWSLMEFNKNTYKIQLLTTPTTFGAAETITKTIKPLTSLYGLFTGLNTFTTKNGDSAGFDRFNGDLSKWDTSMITDMSYMFCGSIFLGDISKWNTSNVTNMEGMFSMNVISIPDDNETLLQPYYCGYTHYDNPPYNYRVSTVEKPSTYVDKINIIDIANWNTSKVTNMRGMFANSYFYKDLSRWNTSNVTDMSYMFSYLAGNGMSADDNGPNARIIGDLSKWNTSNVTNMAFMFTGSKFNSDVSKWDVSNVKDMSCMFKSTRFVGDTSDWDVSNVVSSYDMFAYTHDSSSSDDVNRVLSKWNLLDTNSLITQKYNIKECIAKNNNAFVINSLGKTNSPLNDEFTQVGLTDTIRKYLNQQSEITEDELKTKMRCNLTKVGSQYKYFGDTEKPFTKGDTFVFTINGVIVPRDESTEDFSDGRIYDYNVCGICEYLYSLTSNDSPYLIFRIKTCSDITFENLLLMCIDTDSLQEPNNINNSLSYYSNSYRFKNYSIIMLFRDNNLIDPAYIYVDDVMNYVDAVINLHSNTEANYEYCKKLINLENVAYDVTPRYYKYTTYDSNNNELLNGTCMVKYCTVIGQKGRNCITVVLLNGNGSYDVANKVLFMNNFADFDSYLYKGIKYMVKDENDTPIIISFGDATTAPEKLLANNYYDYTIAFRSQEITGICKATDGNAYYTNIIIRSSTASGFINKTLCIPALINNAESYNLYCYEDNSWNDYGTIKLSLSSDYKILHKSDIQDTSITEYTIESNVVNIDDDTFTDCQNLTKITICSQMVLDNLSKTWLGRLPKILSCQIILSDDITYITADAFKYSKIYSLTMTDSVTSIGHDAFNRCSNVTAITLSKSITAIESWTFVNCNALLSLDIPESVTTIGDHAFDTRGGLKSITFRRTESIDSSTFISSLPGATIIYVPESALETYKTAWSAYTNRIQAIPTSTEN